MRARHITALFITFAMGAQSAGRCRAQAPPSAAGGDEPALARAKHLFEEGSLEYQAARYDRAIELFLDAYALSHAPAILFNIAQAYRLKGPGYCKPALEYYRRSLQDEPDAANRAEIEERAGEMERCVAARSGASPPEPALALPAPRPMEPPRPPDEPRRGRTTAPLIVTTLGAVALVGGGLLYWRASAKFDEVRPTCPCPPGSFSGWEAATYTSYGLIGVGAAALGAGLLWWWKGADGNRGSRMALAPTWGGLVWRGEF